VEHGLRVSSPARRTKYKLTRLDWTLGPNWPTNGEIDIIEGVNNAQYNLMSLHTSPGCTIRGTNETGTLQTNNCDTTVNFNQGCGVTADTTASYGAGFDGGLGGVYATEWTSIAIKVWFFPRSNIPADILAGSPDPNNPAWGIPQANFAGSCNINEHFASHSIIFDTTFCGDYGNSDWNQPGASCMAANPGTCTNYVANNPSAFSQAFWSVNSIKVYQRPTPSTPSQVTGAPGPSSSPVSSVVAPGMGNSTSLSSSATFSAATKSSAAPGATAPSRVGNFEFLGCATSTDGFAGFIQVDNQPLMTLEICASKCSSHEYYGAYNT
jgi:hypothetical protein